MSFLENLEWRRAVKSFATPTSITPAPDISPIIRAIYNAPSSFGLQPYRVIIVTSDAVKRALAPVTFHQPQVQQCTHLLVFCARTDLEERIADYASRPGAHEGHVKMMEEFVSSQSHPTHWAKHQAYIALGFALAAAAEQKITTCPMEGFSADGIAAALDLPTNLVPSALLAIGVSSTDVAPPRFRFPAADLVQHYTGSEPAMIPPQKTKYRHTTPIRKRKPEKEEYGPD